jgi:diaminohydroxyphosphoribosylaminopyrimidine deaminase/5-amino-6-(5-phosphoribosylamino)uracil reductase
MQTALALAEQGRGFVEPNPVVGAVVVRDGRIVGEGWHGRFGGPHAEVYALDNAGEKARGATLFVTLEPCAHHGKTEPCAPRVADAGIAQVVVATMDPTEKTRGRGIALLRERGVRVEVGLCREEAVRQNAAFFKQTALGRPLVTAKWAMTLDGKIATRTGSSRWISSEPARRVVHELRGRVDCIMVGAGTARADDPDLTCRMVNPRRQATRLVVCGRGSIPDDGRLAQTAPQVPVLVAHPQGQPPENADALQGRGCELLPIAGHGAGKIDLEALLDRLGSMDMTNLLVEGGGNLLGGLFDADLVDVTMAFVAPRVAGGEQATTPVGGLGAETMDAARRLHNWHWRRVGDDLLFEGWLSTPMDWAR